MHRGEHAGNVHSHIFLLPGFLLSTDQQAAGMQRRAAKCQDRHGRRRPHASKYVCKQCRILNIVRCFMSKEIHVCSLSRIHKMQ